MAMFVGSRSSPRRVAAAVIATVLVGTVLTLLLTIHPRSLIQTRQARHIPRVNPSTLPTALFSAIPKELNELEMEVPRDKKYTTIPGWPFGLRINEPDTCEGQDVYLLNTITSNPTQIYHRELIRKMWASEAVSRRLKIRTVFIIAAVPSAVTQRHLQEESDKYHDIVQFDFLETRRNLTIKSLAALHWFRAYCSNASWVLKCDVDAFINFWALLDVLKTVEGSSDAVCARSTTRSVCRDAHQMGCLAHYVVDSKEYAQLVYPPYCQGYAYVLHRDLVDRMIEVDQRRTSPPLFLEDVYVTGLLPQDLQARWFDVR